MRGRWLYTSGGALQPGRGAAGVVGVGAKLRCVAAVVEEGARLFALTCGCGGARAGGGKEKSAQVNSDILTVYYSVKQSQFIKPTPESRASDPEESNKVFDRAIRGWLL